MQNSLIARPRNFFNSVYDAKFFKSFDVLFIILEREAWAGFSCRSVGIYYYNEYRRRKNGADAAKTAKETFPSKIISMRASLKPWEKVGATEPRSP